ncbi:MAG: hypothetical protein IJC63_08450, partial [Myxococcaceae bacterium]|nr:hypothetical protein [Myxococcaceae bacterium]
MRLTFTKLIPLLAILAAPAAMAAPRVVDRVAALVNEEMIPLSEIYERAVPHIIQLEQEGSATPERRKAML